MVRLCPKCKKLLKFSYGKLACPTCSYTEPLTTPSKASTQPVPKQCPSCGHHLKHMMGIGWVCTRCTPPPDYPLDTS